MSQRAQKHSACTDAFETNIGYHTVNKTPKLNEILVGYSDPKLSQLYDTE